MGAVLKRLVQKFRDYLGASLSAKVDSAQERFSLVARWKLLLLAFGLTGLWYLAAPAVLSSEERLLWEKVRSAQLHLSQWRQQNDTAASTQSDPWDCGLIGLEWSGITTTLGDLGSKRTACNPAWAVQFGRWFREQGLKPGDHIAIYSSASFPGLLLNAIRLPKQWNWNRY